MRYQQGAIIRSNLETGKESVVAKANVLSFNLSPDGREVVFDFDGVVKIVFLNGGEPRELCRSLFPKNRVLTPENSRLLINWTMDGRYIIVNNYLKSPLNSICEIGESLRREGRH